jgi:uroporphyrinogen-III synthase
MILVTRPQDACLRTKTRLADAGRDVLTDPLLVLTFSPPPKLVSDGAPDAVVITSANGARAVTGHPDLARLTGLPLWTVGSRTTDAARVLGFGVPHGEALDVVSLAELLKNEPAQTFLYLAGEVRAGEFSELLPQHHIDTRVVYSATPSASFAPETVAALSNGGVTSVLHYSRRLAETYLAVSEAANIRAAALTPRHICLSEQVAAPLRAAGALNIAIAAEPREDALLALLAG